jgi:hypothetical protein
VRLLGPLRRGVFDPIEYPRFDGYRASVFLQYHPMLNHFRTVKKYKGFVEVNDGGEMTIV